MSFIKNDIHTYTSLQIKALKICGLWFFIPNQVNSFMFWINILIRATIGTLVFIIPTVGQAIYLFKLIMKGDYEIQEVAGIINLICTETVTSFKLLDMYLRRHKLKKIIQLMEVKEFLHHLSEENYIIKKGSLKIRKLFLWFFISAAIVITVQVIVVPALQGFQTLPLKMDLVVFDVNNEAYFNYLCVFQVMYKPFVLISFVSLQTLRWSCMVYVITQLDILIYNFENMKEPVKAENSEINKAFQEGFKKRVAHHCTIINFVKNIEDVFSWQFILVFIINSLIICTTAVQFFAIKNPLSNVVEIFWVFGFLFIFVVQLFFDCYFGDAITEKNSNISMVVYSYPWTNLLQGNKKNLIIFIARNQRALEINAAKLVPVSMETFTKAMRWTYKGFAVLNQMKN